MRSSSYGPVILVCLSSLVTLAESNMLNSPRFTYESTKNLASVHPSPVNLQPKRAGLRGVFAHGSGPDVNAARVARAAEADARNYFNEQTGRPGLPSVGGIQLGLGRALGAYSSSEMRSRMHKLADFEESGGWINRGRAAWMRKDIKKNFINEKGQYYDEYWAKSPEIRTLLRTKSRSLHSGAPGGKGPVPVPGAA